MIVSKFLDSIPPEQILISDFSLHLIGVILTRLKKPAILKDFTNDLFFNGFISLLTLSPDDFVDLISNIEKFKLDFDDAYQLTLSQKYNLTIVTFDKNFNIEGINKKSPEDIIN